MTTGTSLPEIIAHRGNATEFPENTLQSLASAVELGVKHLEFDVQLTADKVPVLLHDADLERVAEPRGQRSRIDLGPAGRDAGRRGQALRAPLRVHLSAFARHRSWTRSRAGTA